MADKYYSLNDFARERYGKKLYKLSLDGGFTCPNRDGTKGIGGCIFCDNEGSGHFTEKIKLYYESLFTNQDSLDGDTPHINQDSLDGDTTHINQDSLDLDTTRILQDSVDSDIVFTNLVRSALDESKSHIAGKLPADGNYGYIAYFQSYTNTYGPVDKLRKLFYAAISAPEVCVLSIATRPDCLGPEVLELLHELSGKIEVWVELGLQTSKESTVKLINRCYENEVYENAVGDLIKAGVSHIVTHVIIGLPGESTGDILNTIRFVSDTCYQNNIQNKCTTTFGIKLQLLHVLKGTVLAEMYERGEFECLSLEEYTDILKKILEILPHDMVVHRITGDGDKNKLIAPMWSADKKRVLNYLNRNLLK